jgi:hypothetical protein
MIDMPQSFLKDNLAMVLGGSLKLKIFKTAILILESAQRKEFDEGISLRVLIFFFSC